VRRIMLRVSSLTLLAALACVSSRDPATTRMNAVGVSENRAGIAIVASGGISGWEHITVLDSATGRYVTVTRRACAGRCAPLDSASGTLTATDVAHIYTIADSESLFLRKQPTERCATCADQALVTTAVFGNRQRTVVRSDREASPEILGRVHVALAEAIRAARDPSGSGEAISTQPND
jgi:hypothetical protein